MAQIVIRPSTAGGDKKDGHVRSDTPGSNYGDRDYLRLEWIASRTARWFIEFVIPSELHVDRITAAQIEIQVTTPASSAEPCGLFRGTRPEWRELEFSWNKFRFDGVPGDGDWTNLGGDYDTFMAIIPFNLPTSAGQLVIDHAKVLEFVQDAILVRNRKLILIGKRNTESGTQAGIIFRSAEYGTEAHRPALVIEYEPSAVRSGRPPLQRASYRNRLGHRPGSWRPAWLVGAA